MRTPSRSRQRGVGALAVSMLLMLGMSIALLYLNRGLLFEQKASAAQAQSAQAREIAEAGLEWAIGMLNNPNNVDSACINQSTVNGSTTFRVRYVQPALTTGNPTVTPAQTTYPGCRLTAAGIGTCSCPSSGAAALGQVVQPNFTVAFAPVTNANTGAVDTQSVAITATGCSATAPACTAAHAGATSGGPDATATVTAIVKLSPDMPAMAPAPLTCGKSCNVGGSYNIVNRDVATNGILVNSGSNISMGAGVTLSTLQGQPAQNALVGNDESLARLASNDTDCSKSSIFKQYFGTTVQDYRDSPSTYTLSCGSASECKTKLETAYSQGWRSFFLTSDLQLSGNGTLGTIQQPITLVTEQAIKINGSWNFYGLIFSNSYERDDVGTGSSTIEGAIVSCGEYRNNGNGTLVYNADVLHNLRNGQSARFVRVPGSWRDFVPGTAN